VEILKKLSKYKDIHCYGAPFGNHFYGEDIKYDILSNYKFNICFESGIHSGFYTEKPIHAKIAGCLPLYWADENCKNDFNTKSFLNLNDFPSMDEYIERIIHLDQNEDAYAEIACEYLFESKEPSLDSIKQQIRKIL
jgi:hypothetical protein